MPPSTRPLRTSHRPAAPCALVGPVIQCQKRWFSAYLTRATRFSQRPVGRCDRRVQRKCTIERRSRASQTAAVVRLTAAAMQSGGPPESDSRHTVTCSGLSDLSAQGPCQKLPRCAPPLKFSRTQKLQRCVGPRRLAIASL